MSFTHRISVAHARCCARLSGGRARRTPKQRRSAASQLSLEQLEARTLLTAIAAPPGLIAWWPGNGNAADMAGNNDGVLMNGATFAAGMVGQAFKLDGVNDFVQVAHDPSLNPAGGLTIEAWINSSSNAGPRVIVSKWNDNTSDWSYIFKDHNYSDKLRIELSKGSHNDLADLSGTTSIPIGQWIHVAATYDNDVVRLYFNGVQNASLDVDPNQPIQASATDLLIGAVFTSGGVSENFAGLIDEVSLYNRALSAAEIQSIAQAGSDGKYLAMRVNSSSPAAGEVRDATNKPTDFVIDFTYPYDNTSVTPDDLTVNGLPATSIVWTDSDTVTFHFDASPVSLEGPQVMDIVAGDVTTADANAVNPNLLTFHETFYFDTQRLHVVATNPAAGAALAGVGTPVKLVVDFNDPIRDSSVGTDDLVLSEGSVLGARVLDA